MLVAWGSLDSGKVQETLGKALAQPGQWQAYLIQTNSKKRTDAQNRLFQAVLRRLAQQQGRSVQYWKNYLVERFLGFDEVETEDGCLRKVLCPTSDLTVSEFSQFLNACLVFAADLHVDLG